MADVQTSEETLLVDLLFIDGDTRRITLKNPKEDIEASEIAALNTLILNGGTETLLIGDKASSPFRRINKMTRREETVTKLDLT